MATYTKNGMRKAKVNNTNNALKQIRNFGNILENMEKLNKENRAVEQSHQKLTEEKEEL